MAEFKGFIGGAYQAPSPVQDSQECINWYVEIDPTKAQGERQATALYPTPGLRQQISLAAGGEVRGMHVFPGGTQMLVVCADKVYLVE